MEKPLKRRSGNRETEFRRTTRKPGQKEQSTIGYDSLLTGFYLRWFETYTRRRSGRTGSEMISVVL